MGDFVAARRSLKKALLLGSQQPLEKQAVKKAFRCGKMLFTFLCLTVTETQFVCIVYFFIYTADQGCKLEEELSGDQAGSHHSVGLAEQLGDLYCKVGCYSKALDAYQSQVMKTFFQTY